MKDYLNRDERNQLITFMAVIQQIEGIRTLTGERTKPVWEEWKKRNFLTTEESRDIKMANTYLSKFCMSVLDRINTKEKAAVNKQLQKFDFKIIDDFTLKKIFRDVTDRMQNAAVPRAQFDAWCCEIMACECKGCTKHWNECELYTVFEDNFVPDGGWNKENCKFSYEEVKRRKTDALPVHRNGDKQTPKGKLKSAV